MPVKAISSIERLQVVADAEGLISRAGTALVANFSQAATVYRKGGVRVESTNSHASDFTSNLVTIRAEERVALAVRQPLALVKVTTSAAP